MTQLGTTTDFPTLDLSGGIPCLKRDRRVTVSMVVQGLLDEPDLAQANTFRTLHGITTTELIDCTNYDVLLHHQTIGGRQ